MTFKEKMVNLLSRKIITASIVGSLYAVLFGLVTPNPFGNEINSLGEYMWGFVVSTPTYMIYSFPVILIYGTLTSTLSDSLSKFISKKTAYPMELYISAAFHLLFGLILLWVSLSASAIFFITDRILSKRDTYGWVEAYRSLCIPILVWIAFMSIIWLRG